LVCYYYYYEKKYKLDLKDKIKNHKNVDKMTKKTKKNPKNKDQTEINLLVLKKS
jgi:hypothetical protein